MFLHHRYVDLHQVLEQLYSKLDFAFIAPVKRKEVERVNEVTETVKGLSCLIFGKHACENLREQEKVSDWRQVWPQSNQHFSNFLDFLFKSKVPKLIDLYLALPDILNHHGSQKQVVSDNQRPESLATRGW